MMVNIHDNSHSSVILGVAISCVILSTLSFALRIWARWLSVVDFWYDDLLMTFAMVFSIQLPFTEPRY